MLVPVIVRIMWTVYWWLLVIVVNNNSYIFPGNTPLPRKMSQIDERARTKERRKKKKTNSFLMKKELPEPMRQ